MLHRARHEMDLPFISRSILASTVIFYLASSRIPSAHCRRASGETEDVTISRPSDTSYREPNYPAGNPVSGTYHPNRRSSSSSSRFDDDDYSHGSSYGSSYSPSHPHRTTTGYSSRGNSRSRWNDDYDVDSYIPQTTKKPSRSSGGIFQSIKDLLSHSSSSTSSGTSNSKHRPSTGYDDYSDRPVDHKEDLLIISSSKSSLGDAFSKYGKYLIPALTMAGKHLPKLLGKKFGSGNKEVTDSPPVSNSHSDTYSPANIGDFGTLVNRESGQWSNGKRVVPIGSPIPFTQSPVDIYVPTRLWKTFAPWTKARGEVESATSAAIPASRGAENAGLKNDEVCNLVRWNREIPFTELPTMVLAYLANNSASGTNVVKKASALRGLLDRTEETFNSDEVLDTEPAFAVPAGLTWQSCFDRRVQSVPSGPPAPLSTRCLMAQRLKANWPECMPVSSTTTASVTSRTKEPMLGGLDRLRTIYLGNTEDGQLDLDDLMQAAVACLNPKEDKSIRTRLANCLDYSLHAEQVINAEIAGSVFGNEEVCSRFLSFDVARCAGLVPRNAPADPEPSACQVDQLLIISAFARNFYSCHDEIDPKTVAQLQHARSSKSAQG